MLPFLLGVQRRGRKKGSFPHLETNATVGASDDDQLAVQPLLPSVDPHRQLLPQPEGDHHQGCVEGGGGEEGEKCGHHLGTGTVGQSSEGLSFSERKSLYTFTLQLFTKLVKHQNKDEGCVDIIERSSLSLMHW